MTANELRNYTLKDLGQMAKQEGVPGWHAMRKDQLVTALARAFRGKRASRSSKSKRATTSRATTNRGTTSRKSKTASRSTTTTAKRRRSSNASNKSSRNSKAKTSPQAQRRIAAARAKASRRKDISIDGPNGQHNGSVTQDRLVVMVRDSFWLHAYWELTHRGVQRAEAAMGQDWHAARPVLRLLEVQGAGTSTTSESIVRHIDIHGGVNNWYVDVDDPPKTYRMEIGYLSTSGKFFSLARSNMVTTPRPGSSDAIDENWADVAENVDRIYALSGGKDRETSSSELRELFEERLRRPMGSPLVGKYGIDVDLAEGDRPPFNFELDAELIIYGNTNADAHITLQGEPVQLRPDGSFTVRFGMPDCRQVIPVVASSGDGVEQRTIVLAVERNTKVMEPVIRTRGD